MPEPNDIYISAAAISDIVFVGGSTYIWVTGPDGHRHRHFYGHGDRRAEIYHRRENLRSMAPSHPVHAAVPHTLHANQPHPQRVSAMGHVDHAHPSSHAAAANPQTPQPRHPAPQAARAAQTRPAPRQTQARMQAPSPASTQTRRDASAADAHAHHRPEQNAATTKANFS
ncbi:hypothetical protein [Paraburkholderia sp. DHOC27]|uniref:hypothetical protein n=1 Tax=Paraburkholderia sp. DHOC27 TaxID=2303330 RepID=UPI0011C14712|nr:hypothetical protein [Paraburkholderia sp. DHOC27]